MTALAVTVDDVVVHQREVVDELDGDGTGHADGGRCAHGFGGQHRERGPYPLAPVPGHRVALGVGPAEVVRHGRAERGIEPADCGAHGGLHQRARSFQRTGYLRAIRHGGRRHGSQRPIVSRADHRAASEKAAGTKPPGAVGRSNRLVPRLHIFSASTAADWPLRTAPSMVAGHPVRVHAPASVRPRNGESAAGR